MAPISLDGIEAATRLLEPQYLDYASSVSTAAWAASLPLNALLLELCRVLAPSAVIDLGSGFSSFTLRLYARDAGVPVRAVSVDDAPEWLAATRLFLERSGVSTDAVVSWQELPRQPDFDLVLHDLGAFDTRGETLASALGLARPAGLVILDDLHQRDYRDYVEAVLPVFACVAYDLRAFTLDGFGRYSWAVTSQDEAEPGAPSPQRGALGG